MDDAPLEPEGRGTPRGDFTTCTPSSGRTLRPTDLGWGSLDSAPETLGGGWVGFCTVAFVQKAASKPPNFNQD